MIQTIQTYLRLTTGSDVIPVHLTIERQFQLYDTLGGERFLAELERQQGVEVERRSTIPARTPVSAQCYHAKEEPSSPKKKTKRTSKHKGVSATSGGEEPSSLSSSSSSSDTTFDPHPYQPGDDDEESVDWFAVRARQLDRLRPRPHSKKAAKVSKKASAVYNFLQKKAGSQSFPILQSVTDQVKRASAYRKWVAALYFVLLHNSHAREILDPITFEVNMYVSLPLDVLEGTALFISSKIGERLRPQLRNVDSLDPVSLLLKLEQYCVPTNPAVRNQLQVELHALRINSTETGTQFISRFTRKIEHAYAHRIHFTESTLVDMLLEGFGTCERKHQRYEAQVMQFRMQRSVEDNSYSKSRCAEPLTMEEVEQVIDSIDMRHSHLAST